MVAVRRDRLPGRRRRRKSRQQVAQRRQQAVRLLDDRSGDGDPDTKRLRLPRTRETAPPGRRSADRPKHGQQDDRDRLIRDELAEARPEADCDTKRRSDGGYRGRYKEDQSGTAARRPAGPWRPASTRPSPDPHDRYRNHRARFRIGQHAELGQELRHDAGG